eukprot:jgi/Mesvir1/7544/Mv19289-RA.1
MSSHHEGSHHQGGSSSPLDASRHRQGSGRSGSETQPHASDAGIIRQSSGPPGTSGVAPCIGTPDSSGHQRSFHGSMDKSPRGPPTPNKSPRGQEQHDPEKSPHGPGSLGRSLRTHSLPAMVRFDHLGPTNAGASTSQVQAREQQKLDELAIRWPREKGMFLATLLGWFRSKRFADSIPVHYQEDADPGDLDAKRLGADSRRSSHSAATMLPLAALPFVGSPSNHGAGQPGSLPTRATQEQGAPSSASPGPSPAKPLAGVPPSMRLPPAAPVISDDATLELGSSTNAGRQHNFSGGLERGRSGSASESALYPPSKPFESSLTPAGSTPPRWTASPTPAARGTHGTARAHRKGKHGRSRPITALALLPLSRHHDLQREAHRLRHSLSDTSSGTSGSSISLAGMAQGRDLAGRERWSNQELLSPLGAGSSVAVSGLSASVTVPAGSRNQRLIHRLSRSLSFRSPQPVFSLKSSRAALARKKSAAPAGKGTVSPVHTSTSRHAASPRRTAGMSPSYRQRAQQRTSSLAPNKDKEERWRSLVNKETETGPGGRDRGRSGRSRVKDKGQSLLEPAPSGSSFTFATVPSRQRSRSADDLRRGYVIAKRRPSAVSPAPAADLVRLTSTSTVGHRSLSSSHLAPPWPQPQGHGPVGAILSWPPEVAVRGEAMGGGAGAFAATRGVSGAEAAAWVGPGEGAGVGMLGVGVGVGAGANRAGVGPAASGGVVPNMGGVPLGGGLERVKPSQRSQSMVFGRADQPLAPAAPPGAGSSRNGSLSADAVSATSALTRGGAPLTTTFSESALYGPSGATASNGSTSANITYTAAATAGEGANGPAPLQRHVSLDSVVQASLLPERLPGDTFLGFDAAWRVKGLPPVSAPPEWRPGQARHGWPGPSHNAPISGSSIDVPATPGPPRPLEPVQVALELPYKPSGYVPLTTSPDAVVTIAPRSVSPIARSRSLGLDARANASPARARPSHGSSDQMRSSVSPGRARPSLDSTPEHNNVSHEAASPAGARPSHGGSFEHARNVNVSPGRARAFDYAPEHYVRGEGMGPARARSLEDAGSLDQGRGSVSPGRVRVLDSTPEYSFGNREATGPTGLRPFEASPEHRGENAPRTGGQDRHLPASPAHARVGASPARVDGSDPHLSCVGPGDVIHRYRDAVVPGQRGEHRSKHALGQASTESSPFGNAGEGPAGGRTAEASPVHVQRRASPGGLRSLDASSEKPRNDTLGGVRVSPGRARPFKMGPDYMAPSAGPRGRRVEDAGSYTLRGDSPAASQRTASTDPSERHPSNKHPSNNHPTTSPAEPMSAALPGPPVPARIRANASGAAAEDDMASSGHHSGLDSGLESGVQSGVQLGVQSGVQSGLDLHSGLHSRAGKVDLDTSSSGAPSPSYSSTSTTSAASSASLAFPTLGAAVSAEISLAALRLLGKEAGRD